MFSLYIAGMTYYIYRCAIMSQQLANVRFNGLHLCVSIYMYIYIIYRLQKYTHDDDIITLMIYNAGSVQYKYKYFLKKNLFFKTKRHHGDYF